MTFDQGEFNFNADSSEAGYRRWREELDTTKKAFESRWGVILSRRVRVVLRNYEKPLVGILEWVEPAKKSRDGQPLFRLRGVEFQAGEIKSIVRQDDE